jgi:recombination protein RecA
MYNEGISSTGSLLDLALEMEIVQKRGSWFSYNGNQLAQGRDAAKELLKGDAALYEELAAKVREGLETKRRK